MRRLYGRAISMQASVIVSTYNRRELVLRTVRTLLQQDLPCTEYEIIVVVDGSRDGTAQALRDLGDQLRLIEQENRGLAGARNTGARAACSPLLIFLDDDMQCVPGLLRAHLAAHAEAAGREIVALGAIYAAPESPKKLAAEHFSRGLGAPYLRQREHSGEPWPDEVWSFANTSIPRSLIEQVGGFDERLRMREDAELGARLRAAGVRQQFVSGAVAYQWCDKSVRQLMRDAQAFAEFDLMFMCLHAGEEPHGFLKRIRAEPSWKRVVRRILVARPEIADAVLAPVCALGERVPALRDAAVKALLLRYGLHWLHRIVELSGKGLGEL